jgi:LPXTG-motif cell wall-anchored protein
LDETLDPKNANGYYVLSSDTKYVPIGYNAQGSVPTEENYPTLRVGNMATEKVEGQLPSTGGSGVTTYYYLGGVIMLLSIAGFTGLKRREKKRRKEE